MKYTKHIPGCRCCSNTYAVNWKHNFIQLSVNNWRNAELGFDLVLVAKDKRNNHSSDAGILRGEINLLWFTLGFERHFLNAFWSSKNGNLDVYPITTAGISAQVYVHQYPLNAKWDFGFVIGLPFMPTIAYHACRMRTKEEEAIWEEEQN